jgi:hypothetical protein
VTDAVEKVFLGVTSETFLKLRMHFVRSDVRDHIVSQKNDHGPSYRHHRASQGGSPKITICEIFGVVRFGKVEGHPRFMAGSPKASIRAI